MKTQSLLVVGALVMASATAAAWASKDPGRDAVTDYPAAAAQGRAIAPMESVIAVARTAQPGTLLEVELEDERGAPRYEIKIVDAEGRRHELVFDAVTIAPIAPRDDR